MKSLRDMLESGHSKALALEKRLAIGYPEILSEVELLIAEQSPGASPAFHARARREFGKRRAH